MIADYERFGSYSTLHILRKWVLVNEEGYTQEQVDAMYDYKNPGKALEAKKYPALLEHSDCDGGYLDPSMFSVELTNKMEWGDIRDLKAEVEQLSKKEMPEEVRIVLERLIDFLADKDDESVSIMYFM